MDVSRAVSVLRAGGLLVLPTETVYGLAADAEQRRAVARIYAVKGRPADHPLILHIAGIEALGHWVDLTAAPAYAGALASALWPGPLTLVLPRSNRVGDHVTGGQDTVAVRVPDHPIALAVLAAFDGAVAAPSANRFGHVSPTDVQHVIADIGDQLTDDDAVVDGGPCQVGVESTIVDCSGDRPRLLRPGWYGADDLVVAGGVPLDDEAPEPRPRVSGSMTSHYAPRAAVVLRSAEDLHPTPDDPVSGLLAPAGVETPTGWVRLSEPATSADYARVLYSALREADALELERVVAVLPSGDDGVVGAIRDRLTRASTDR